MVAKNVFLLFFENKLALLLKILLNRAIGVRIKKNIAVSKILGIIWLKTNATLNHTFSIMIDIFVERTLTPDMIIKA
tara:strand:+ start:150 stop:380 length:231 start_codon:yes stop_codon:yes gene_type:complete